MSKTGMGMALAALLVLGTTFGAGAVPLKGDNDNSSNISGADPHDSSVPKKQKKCKVKMSRRIAYQMARDPWFDKVAAADPPIVAAVCAHPGPAKIIAAHPHIAQIAEADHYLCRRLTRWTTVTDVLIHNANCDRVITLDPQGIYFAIARTPGVARVLSSHQAFHEMISLNPDLGRVISEHMR